MCNYTCGSLVEGLVCVIIASRGFCARQTLIGLQGATCPRWATGPRGATSPAAKPKERRSRRDHTPEYGYGYGTRTRTYKTASNPYPYPYPYQKFCQFYSVIVPYSPELKSTRTPSIFPYPPGKRTRTCSRTRT